MRQVDQKIEDILDYFEGEPILLAKNDKGITFLRCWLPSEHEPQLAMHGFGCDFEEALDVLHREVKKHQRANS